MVIGVRWRRELLRNITASSVKLYLSVLRRCLRRQEREGRSEKDEAPHVNLQM